MTERKYNAVNWDKDSIAVMFWEQNLKQFWIDTEFVPSKDISVWNNKMSDEERDTYRKVLGGLTLLDTLQGGVGMPKILDHVEDLQSKSVLTFMSAMESIHAKSYSTIFTTIDEKDTIYDVFNWVLENPYLQNKARIIDKYYRSIDSKKDLYMAMVASVYLESFLFYSGFFYPLYVAGQGRMIASGEIINLIIRDESIHGVFVGLLAQEVYEELTEDEKKIVDNLSYQLLFDLMDNEEKYTDELYSKINLSEDVKTFIKYNANKALMNLGKEPYYVHEDVNPIVLNGIGTDTKTFDFFSNKGNGYQKGKVAPITDDTFAFVNNKLKERV